MAIRKIAILGEDEILRKRSIPVENFDTELHLLLEDMKQTLYDADGVGLAAPQVGALLCVVVIDAGDGLMELINPEIVETEGCVTVLESCLSVPGHCGLVQRPKKVTVRAQSRNGAMMEVVGEGYLAVALCHEIDHLQGVLYVDKMIEEVSGQHRQVRKEDTE